MHGVPLNGNGQRPPARSPGGVAAGTGVPRRQARTTRRMAGRMFLPSFLLPTADALRHGALRHGAGPGTRQTGATEEAVSLLGLFTFGKGYL